MVSEYFIATKVTVMEIIQNMGCAKLCILHDLGAVKKITYDK